MENISILDQNPVELLDEHDLTTQNETKSLKIDVLEIKRHPKYQSRTSFDYDFALLKLNHSVDFASNHGIRTACMPKRHTFVGNLSMS